MIALLAALCAGRNYQSQEIIKKIVPVNFILGVLELLTDVTDFTGGFANHSSSGGQSARARREEESAKKQSESNDVAADHVQTPEQTLSELFQAFVMLTSHLHIHSVFLDPVPQQIPEKTLVWSAGEAYNVADYEDTKGAVTNRIFSAATQFDEPLSAGRGKKANAEEWHRWIMVDLCAYSQRERLREIVDLTFFNIWDKEGGVVQWWTIQSALQAVEVLLDLVKDLMCSKFYSATYEVFPFYKQVCQKYSKDSSLDALERLLLSTTVRR